MSNLGWAILLLVLALVGIVIRKAFYFLPPHETKRQAEQGNPLTVQLYRAVAYGSSLRLLLWLYIGLTAAGGLVLLARAVNAWLAFVVVAVFLWLAFSLLPSTRVTKIGMGVTKLTAPLLAWLLSYLHRPLTRTADLLQQRYVSGQHTGLFERQDLVELIERQQFQSDSRLTEEELEIIRRALSFGDYKVADVLVPRKKVKTVLAGDTIGPILIDEVHKSKQDYVLVKDKKGGLVVGTLAASRLGLDSSGQVRDLMDNTVNYLHENDSLSEALHAFFATNHAMFVVVNSFEEFVGIVTVEEIIKQLLGHVPGDDFDQYSDPAAVAARHSKPAAEAEAEPTHTEEKVVE